MPRQIAPTGLVAPYPDAEILPKIPVSGTRAVGAWVLPYTRPGATGTGEPAGAAAAAEAGIVVAQTPNPAQIAELGPLILASPLRSLSPKVGNVDVFIIGAEARAQGENFEGTDVTIRIDGASGFALASAPSTFQGADAEGAAIIHVTGRGPRIAVGET